GGDSGGLSDGGRCKPVESLRPVVVSNTKNFVCPFSVMKNRIFTLLIVLFLLPVVLVANTLQKDGETKTSAGPAGDDQNSPGILPPSFNGWRKNERTVKTSTDPAMAAPADAAVLKEY